MGRARARAVQRNFFSPALLLLGLTAACGDDASEPANAGGGSGGVSATGGTAGSGNAAGSGGDAAAASGGVAGQAGGAGSGGVGGTQSQELKTFDDIKSGATKASDGLLAIAQAGGFPIPSPAGFVFARVDDGKGPYALAGDFNGWTPAPMQLTQGMYWISVAVPTPDGAKYKFVDGGQTFAADPYARRYGWDQNGEYSLVLSSAPHRERFPEMSGNGRPPRTVRLWISQAKPTHHLYTHDGQNLFEPTSIFGGWKLDQTAGAKTLIVGIDNIGAGRMDEYTHISDNIGSGPVGGKGDDYADFVEQVVRPAVEKRYGTPSKVGVMGSSLGGLIAIHQVLRHPGRYDFAASLSGTLGWGSIGPHKETLIERFETAGKQTTKIYLDSGGGPGSGCIDSDSDGIQDDAAGAKDNYCETVQLRDVLSAAGYTFDTELWHWYESGAPHSETAWAARVFRPLSAFEAL